MLEPQKHQIQRLMPFCPHCGDSRSRVWTIRGDGVVQQIKCGGCNRDLTAEALRRFEIKRS